MILPMRKVFFPFFLSNVPVQSSLLFVKFLLKSDPNWALQKSTRRHSVASDKHIRAAHILLKQGISTLSLHLPVQCTAGFHVSRSCRVPSCVQTRSVVIQVPSLSASAEPSQGKRTGCTCLCSFDKDMYSVEATEP